MFLKYRVFIILLFLLTGSFIASAQEGITPADSLDVTPADTVLPKKTGLEAPVNYQAKDSIVMTAGNWAYLFGEGKVTYQNIELESEEIELNMDSSLVYATFGLDSAGLEFGYPLFKEGEQQYESKTMRYNFQSKKGFITDVITQQGEGYVTSGRTKKMPSDALNMAPGRYTTCDNHDHPHFYIHMTKAKVRPKKDIVTGPVYLVLEDVPLYPIGLPFAFFPFTSTYSSGILMPTFGEENTRGFYLRDGGYYFALSDYIDLALTGEIYTKGSWGLAARSSYRKRYKYSGSFNAAYQVSRYGDVIRGDKLPDYSLSKDFKINWSHSQDAKANPYLTFSASVNFSTSSFDRNNANGLHSNSGGGYLNATENNKSSTVNITKRFPNSPFSLSGTMSVNQRMKDSSLAVTLPDITVTMSRIFPFKRKQRVGAERWYEKISMSYTGYLRNNINTKEDQFLNANIIKDWKNAMQHKIPISATFSLFNYINITPSVNYTERWYSNKVNKEYDLKTNSVVAKDTLYGFYRVYDYDASVSASTTVYGNFKPWTIFGDKVQMIRHRFEPSVSLSAAPDFGASHYGYHERFIYEDINGEKKEYSYSPFENGQFGYPSKGKRGSVSFSVSNNVEAKIRSDKDSTGFRKISLIDKLSFSISNNLAADSFQWSDINSSLRLKLSKSYTLNLNATFDTYTYEYNEVSKTLSRQNKTRWEAGKGFGRLRSTGTSFSYTLNNDTFSKWFGGGSDKKGAKGTDGTGEEQGQTGLDDFGQEQTGQQETETASGGRLRKDQSNEASDADADGYYMNKVPWSLSFNYSMNLGYDNQKIDIKNKEYKYKLTHNLSFNGNIQPTKNWRFNFNATYDFDNKKIAFMNCNISRSLHCWQMTASFVPIGPYKTYSFSIAVNSSLLKDLKWDQSSNYRDGQSWY
ncbi:putative LPS assembly protein LptD [Massilibacteroides sp.]|uniref:putative LPS assembly protein LptD n=1 Tax=Massilibacteroides sp. TaxID=2034766 RepID=UPI002633B8A4|nr:putative LPS assembly protein LptD [Massilibacteroides sp.]MDD4515732.1 putative LPS assembly protein LptD [Massilibacteroides sp.]